MTKNEIIATEIKRMVDEGIWTRDDAVEVAERHRASVLLVLEAAEAYDDADEIGWGAPELIDGARDLAQVEFDFWESIVKEYGGTGLVVLRLVP
jgi:hypothetical protein